MNKLTITKYVLQQFTESRALLGTWSWEDTMEFIHEDNKESNKILEQIKESARSKNRRLLKKVITTEIIKIGDDNESEYLKSFR